MALSQIHCLDDNNVNLRTNESKPDFFYSEDQRLALEALIKDGRDAFDSYIQEHNVREFLSELEVERLASVAEVYEPGTVRVKGKRQDSSEDETASLQYWPDRSDYSVPSLDLGWPDCASFRGVTRVNVYTQPPAEGQAHIKEVIRKTIAQAQKVIAVVMDLFTDVDIFIDLLDAGFKRKVAIYIILDASGLSHFLSMCRRAGMHKGHLKNLRVRSTRGTEFYTRSARKVFGSLGQKFMFVDGDRAVSGSYSFTWTASRLDRNIITVLTGQAVETFDKQFQYLYLTSEAVNLTEVNMEMEPELERIPAPVLAPIPSAAVARRLINPKYALVTNNTLEADGKSSSGNEHKSKNPIAKVLRPPREIPEPLPIHPGLLNLERVSMIPYLPTWPEPDPPSDVIGFINIRDSSKPMQVHLMRSELFETSQAIRFKEPFVPPEDPLSQKTCSRLKPIKNTDPKVPKSKENTESKHHNTSNEQGSAKEPLDQVGPPVIQGQEQTQSQNREMLGEPGNKAHSTDQTHPLDSQDKEHTEPQNQKTLHVPGHNTQPRDQTQSPVNQNQEYNQLKHHKTVDKDESLVQATEKSLPLVSKDPVNNVHTDEDTLDNLQDKAQIIEKTHHPVPQELAQKESKDEMALDGLGCKMQPTDYTHSPCVEKQLTQPQNQDTLLQKGSNAQLYAQSHSESKTQPTIQTHVLGPQNLEKECKDQGICIERNVKLIDQRDSSVSPKSGQAHSKFRGTVDVQGGKAETPDQKHILEEKEAFSPVPKPRTIHLVFDSDPGKDISMVMHNKVDPSHGHTSDHSIKHTEDSVVHGNVSFSTVQTDKESPEGDKTCLRTGDQKDENVLMIMEGHSGSESPTKGSDVSSTSEEYFECVDSDSSNLKPESLYNGIHNRLTPLEDHGNPGRLKTKKVVKQSIIEPQTEKQQQDGRQKELETMCLEIASKQKLIAQRSYGNDKKQHHMSLHSPLSNAWLVQKDQERGYTKPEINGNNKSHCPIKPAEQQRSGSYLVTRGVRAGQGGILSNRKAYKKCSVDTSSQKGRSQGSSKRLTQAQRAKPKSAWFLSQSILPRRYPASQGNNLTPFGIPLASLSHFKHLRQKIPGSTLEVLQTTAKVTAPATQEQYL